MIEINIKILLINIMIQTTKKKGFTLIELSVVLVIIGLVISTIASVMPSLIRSSKIKKGLSDMDKLANIMEGYIAANAKLPYADDVTENDGRGNTGTYFGYLPYLDLGLTTGNDLWGNRIKYGVNENLTQAGTSDRSWLADRLAVSCPSTFTNTILYIGPNPNEQNVAFVIVSGGLKDKDNDGADSFFDGMNEDNDAGYNDPAEISSTYDDIMFVQQCFYLIGSLGLGNPGTYSGTGGGSSYSPESSDSLCSDGQDNDSDGYIDCHDQDCCSAGLTVCAHCPPLDSCKCSLISMSAGNAGQYNYSHQFDSTGGSGFSFIYLNSITPAISGLSMNVINGILSGTINVCSGTYNVNITCEDRYDSNCTDTPPDYQLVVNSSSLNISPGPAGTEDPDFTVNSTIFSQNFTGTGNHVGSLNWVINWIGGDPSGFRIRTISDSNAIFEKYSTTNQGTYTFSLSVTDSTCTGSTFTSSNYSLLITEAGVNPPYNEGLNIELLFDECDEWSGVFYDVYDSFEDTNHYGKAFGGVLSVHSGKICKAAYFDGNDDKIKSKILEGDDIIVFEDEVTLACWFRSPGGGGSNPRLIEFSNENGDYEWSTALAYDNDGSIRAWVTDETTSQRGGQIDYSDELFNDNKWHYIAYTYSPSNGGILYIDNEIKQNATDHITSNIHDAKTYVIGGYYPNNSHGFKGYIDEVMIFGKEKTAQEIEDIYNRTNSITTCSGECYDGPIAEYLMEEDYPWGTTDNVKDTGSGSNDGEPLKNNPGNISQTSTEEGKVCRAGNFYRHNSTKAGYIDFNDPIDGDLDPDDKNMTISTWFKSNNTTGQKIIYNKDDLYSAGIIDGYLKFSWEPEWESVLSNWSGGNSFPVNQDEWIHVTIVYNNKEQLLYKDGVQVFFQDVTGNIGSNGSKFLIGASGDTSPTNFFDGLIDEFRIYHRALSENEIITDMNKTRACE